MRFWLITLLLFHTSVWSKNITHYLDPQISHSTPIFEHIDATFMIQLGYQDNCHILQHDLEGYGIPSFVYKKFEKINPEITEKFCSPNISPYLLTEILSHLSIYRYCLNQGIENALVIESRASLKQDPTLLDSILEGLNQHLDKKSKSWDLFYTDVDYHDQETGEVILPRLEKIPINRRRVTGEASKIYARYGCTAYVISSSGMQKILDYYDQKWNDRPFDQTLFKVPHLRVYGVNQDIITNRYSINRPSYPIHNPFPPHFETGDSLWLKPTDLLITDRFDLVAKYIYAKYHINKYATNWHIELYKSHLESWVQFYNTQPLKTKFKDWTSAFNKLIKNFKKNEFKKNRPIPINNIGIAFDGAHRIGAALALDIPVRVKVSRGTSTPNMTYLKFRNKYHLDEKYLDHMAYEYTKLKPNARILTLFPSGNEAQARIESILKEHGTIVFHKEIYFTQSGGIEYLHLLLDEDTPSRLHYGDYDISSSKAGIFFPGDIHPLHIYLFEVNDPEMMGPNIVELERKCLEISDAIHLNVTHDHTVRNAATIFNANSISFLNRRKRKEFSNFERLFEKLHEFIAKYNIDREMLCVDTGSVLSAHGLRDCNDMDILHKIPLPPEFINYDIDSHNPHLHHHAVSLDEILFNPENHFYFRGIKFVAPELAEAMKKDRGSKKDLRDIELFHTLGTKL